MYKFARPDHTKRGTRHLPATKSANGDRHTVYLARLARGLVALPPPGDPPLWRVGRSRRDAGDPRPPIARLYEATRRRAASAVSLDIRSVKKKEAQSSAPLVPSLH